MFHFPFSFFYVSVSELCWTVFVIIIVNYLRYYIKSVDLY